MAWIGIISITLLLLIAGAGPFAFVAFAALVAVYYLSRITKAKEAAVLIDAADRDQRLKWERLQAEAKHRGVSPQELLDQMQQLEDLALKIAITHVVERDPELKSRLKSAKKQSKVSRRWLVMGACGWCGSMNINDDSISRVCSDCGRSSKLIGVK